MVNAGAIMTAGLINPKSSYSQRLRYIRQEFGKLIGWNPKHDCRVDLPRFNKDMARQENFTGYNNIAMGYLLMATGNLPHTKSEIQKDIHPDLDDYDFYTEPAVTEALKLYFSVCSLEMTSTDVAMAAATLLMVEKIENIVARQVEAISNLLIDKITVWDSAGGGSGEGSTANFVSSLIHSLPPVHDVAKMAGVDLPDYLGSMKEE